MKDIHNIMPPVQVGFDPAVLKIILIVCGVVVLLILLFLLIKKVWKKKHNSKDVKLLPEPVSAYETALKLLDLLLQSSIQNKRIFYFDLSAIFRNYIAGSFNINAVEMTSQEFLRNINFLAIDNKIKKEISNFFNSSDAFKYAGVIPQKDQIDKDLLFIKNAICKIENDLCIQREKQEEKSKNRQNLRRKQ